ncbi:F-type H+-transporting ATPase subunit b [Palleronia aestuarii]|uniref:ATP synthase subunit b n=1 Tax=Palleronia aestuarii TaxID=568105 RepID=A0A2W7N6L9_9RHOB|nr:F0F1 ATP synthase subunit B' [Palleronia aestuarii]PZX15748.1 F-type H+-transporting ATPase subunit b [Palleronia aestuarii]
MEHEEVESVLGTGDAVADGTGMPQLDLSTFPNQIFWLIIALVAIYFVLARVALPRIGAVLAERQGTITNDIAAAEELKLKAADAEKAYDKALADARAEAQRIAEKNRAEMQATLDEKQEEADREIAEQVAESETRIAEIRDSAMANVEEVAKETAEALVAALGGQADSEAVNAAVDERMEERSR